MKNTFEELWEAWNNLTPQIKRLVWNRYCEHDKAPQDIIHLNNRAFWDSFTSPYDVVKMVCNPMYDIDETFVKLTGDGKAVSGDLIQYMSDEDDMISYIQDHPEKFADFFSFHD